MPDTLIRAIDREARTRILSVISTDLVREASSRHGAEGIGACALGRGLTASLLLSTLAKSGERVTLQLRGDGPLGGLTADATDEGLVRGFVLHPDRAIAPVSGRCRVVEALGRSGVVNVLRDLQPPGADRPDRYQGQTALLTGEVDEDVEGYLRNSEQIASALGCDVVFDPKGGRSPIAAGGVLVQAMPDATNELVFEAQRRMRTGRIFETLKRDGISASELAQAIYGGEIEVLSERPVAFRCRCSRQRVVDVITGLGPIEIDEIIATTGFAEVTCHFCNERYVVERPELEQLRESEIGPRENN